MGEQASEQASEQIDNWEHVEKRNIQQTFNKKNFFYFFKILIFL